MKNLVEKFKKSCSPFVRRAASNLNSKKFSSVEACKKALAEEVCQLQKMYSVVEDKLIKKEKVAAVRAAIKDGRNSWEAECYTQEFRVLVWCPVNGCHAGEGTFPSMETAINFGQSADCGCGEMAVVPGGMYRVTFPDGSIWEGNQEQSP